MKQIRKGILALLLAGCASIALVGCGNEEDGVNNTVADNAAESNVLRETDAADKNGVANSAAADETKENGGAAETERRDNAGTNREDLTDRNADDAADAENENVNSVTSGRDDDGVANEDDRAAENGSDGALEEIGAGVGEVGDGIINGAADIVDDVTGTAGADNTAR